MRGTLSQVALQVGFVVAAARRLAPAEVGVVPSLLEAGNGDQVVVRSPGLGYVIPLSHGAVNDSSHREVQPPSGRCNDAWPRQLARAWPDACRAGRMRLMEHFRTPRLIARDWTTDDAQAAFDIYGRDEVMRWLGAQPRRAVPSLTQMRERLDLMIQRASDEPGYGLWAVSLRTGPVAGTVVGAVLLSRLRCRRPGVRARTAAGPGHRACRSGQRQVSGGLPPPRHDTSRPDRQLLRTLPGTIRSGPHGRSQPALRQPASAGDAIALAVLTRAGRPK